MTDDELDAEILDRDRAQEIAQIAEDYIARLDLQRELELESIEREIERQVADAEREAADWLDRMDGL